MNKSIDHAPLLWRTSDRFQRRTLHCAVQRVHSPDDGGPAHRAPCAPFHAVSSAVSSVYGCGCPSAAGEMYIVSRPPRMVAHTAETHSSLLIGLNWTASSVYSRRHAGQRPLRFSLMWCQQKRHICRTYIDNKHSKSRRPTYLVTTRARLEVDIRYVHLFQAKGALCVLLQAHRRL